MLQLFQTEWCPASRRVRERLTELGVDYVNLQVPQLETLATEAKERLGAVVSRAANSE